MCLVTMASPCVDCSGVADDIGFDLFVQHALKPRLTCLGIVCLCASIQDCVVTAHCWLNPTFLHPCKPPLSSLHVALLSIRANYLVEVHRIWPVAGKLTQALKLHEHLRSLVSISLASCKVNRLVPLGQHDIAALCCHGSLRHRSTRIALGGDTHRAFTSTAVSIAHSSNCRFAFASSCCLWLATSVLVSIGSAGVAVIGGS
mmetsp:Transcript_159298/g.290578  ORF Transcript_159298/g.290578 Transcript_159298/m.290578 type:complete len:202 (+) Transcript_159298:493-1098(+)